MSDRKFKHYYLYAVQLGMFLAGLISLTFSARAEFSTKGDGYIFVTFKSGTGEASEQIYFGVSKDGVNWSALNNGQPVLVSTIGTKGVRDPFILRARDGKSFILIATDLSMHRTADWKDAKRKGSRSLIVWESKDLMHWSKPRAVVVAPKDAGSAWAPEAIYDKEKGEYLVFWASTTKRDHFAKFRIWAAWTKDFRTFSAPFVFIEKTTAVIDTTIVQDRKKYYRFTKDEEFKCITMETALALKGPWSAVKDFSLANLKGYEGPAAYVIEPDDGTRPPVWVLMIDNYSKGLGYQPFFTKDLSSGQFEASKIFSFPFEFRHGSIMPLSSRQYANLVEFYGTKHHNVRK